MNARSTRGDSRLCVRIRRCRVELGSRSFSTLFWKIGIPAVEVWRLAFVANELSEIAGLWWENAGAKIFPERPGYGFGAFSREATLPYPNLAGEHLGLEHLPHFVEVVR